MKTPILLLLGLLLAACVKEELTNTSHPDTAQVTLNPSISGAFVVQLSDGTGRNFTTSFVDDTLAPGRYNFLVYSQGFSVTGGVLNVGTNPKPGLAHAGYVADTLLRADRDYVFSVPMHPLMRTVNFTITDNGSSSANLSTITATLSGVASTINLRTDVAGGATTTSAIDFTPSDDKKTWTTQDVRLIDIIGATQNLVLTLRYIDASSETLPAENINAKLNAGATFGSRKSTPLALTTTITTTITTSVDPAFGGTSVSPWVVIPGSGEANEQ